MSPSGVCQPQPNPNLNPNPNPNLSPDPNPGPHLALGAGCNCIQVPFALPPLLYFLGTIDGTGGVNDFAGSVAVFADSAADTAFGFAVADFASTAFAATAFASTAFATSGGGGVAATVGADLKNRLG